MCKVYVEGGAQPTRVIDVTWRSSVALQFNCQNTSQQWSFPPDDKKDGIRSSWSSNLGLNGSNERANQSHRNYMLTQLTFLEQCTLDHSLSYGVEF